MINVQQNKILRPLDTAVLFLIFNRLDTTRQVFEAIRQVQPRRLYVAADGPRSGHAGEEERVCVVRNYVLGNIDWDCEVKTLFREKNLGCGVAVSNAIDWFFEHEEQGIILEDDILPDQSFFPFCEELLKMYEGDSEVMIVSGDFFASGNFWSDNSYYFSRYPFMWGWATWRRAWRCNDRLMTKWPYLKSTNFLDQFSDGNKYFSLYWSNIFDMVCSGREDIWDYHFLFACWVNRGICITPYKNLVKNIGFGADATHTFDDKGWIANLPLERIEFPLVHPVKRDVETKIDSWCGKKVYGISKFSSLKFLILQYPGGDLLAKIVRFFKNLFY